MKRALIFTSGLAVAALALSIACWNSVPDRIPVHWNLHGEPDRYGSRLEGLLVMPALIALLPALIALLVRIGPRREHMERSSGAIGTIIVAIGALFTGIHVLALHAATSPDPTLDGRWIFVGMGVLFVVLGNMMPKIRSNYFVGIRTPWTLESDRVWTLTHRFGGWSMAIGGLAVLVAAFALPMATAGVVCFSIIMVASLLPVIYSWRVSLREPMDGPHDLASP
jgi:uncharacterized membrane protein